MPTKAKDAEVAALAGAMLRELEGLRHQGGSDNPPTLRQLAALTGGSPTDELVQKAAAKKVFTDKAVVTEKVGRTPSLDAPVYLKGDAPTKPKARPKRGPAPPKVDKVADLARRMLAALEAQRRLGPGAYPPTLGRLAELCGVDGSDALVNKAAGHKALSEHAVVAAKDRTKFSLDAPALLNEGLHDGAAALLPALLTFALRHPPTSGKTKSDAFTETDLKGRFLKPLQKPFADALRDGIERRTLPSEVAWVLVKDKPYLFLAERLRPGGLPRADSVAEPAARHAPSRDFASEFRVAFDRLDRDNGATNFVKLSDLRRALPGFDREAFDAGLKQLRLDREFSLDSHEGLHGPLTPEERAAGVHELGSLLVYVARR